jgi:hypothetical protein
MTEVIVEMPTGWDLEPDDFGGLVVRHQHGDLTAVAYLYSNPDRAWAECTMCGAEVDLALPIRPEAATR